MKKKVKAEIHRLGQKYHKKYLKKRKYWQFETKYSYRSLYSFCTIFVVLDSIKLERNLS